jgi:maleate isomerase
MTAEPDYMVMGMSSETFWGGVEGNRQFVKQINELSRGLGVATGAEACERALHLFGVRRLGVVTPYQPVGDQNVRRFFTELGFDVVNMTGFALSHGRVDCPCPGSDSAAGAIGGQ